MFTIFILIAAYIVYRAVRQILRVYECPSDEILTAFWRGKLRAGSEPHRQLITHLGTCEHCQERLHLLRKGLPLEDHLIDEGQD
ncbi:MAG: hypothetical protein RIC19_03160 [Phaeodactylibacter sp.]|uniref:hypothetical protein n=1 Tax=Phaeodactylibacter sp. TaxID=1940289 RepID=UPI0032EFBFAF